MMYNVIVNKYDFLGEGATTVNLLLFTCVCDHLANFASILSLFLPFPQISTQNFYLGVLSNEE